MGRIAARVICVAVSLFIGSCSKDQDSVEQAQAFNENSAIDKEISEFLTEAADARLMDIEEGKLARKKGTTTEIRQYGDRMVKDQSKLLHDIRVLAASKNIILPSTVSDKKADGLGDLRKETGEEFDTEFLKRMTKGHKRDVRAFENATRFDDRNVRKFANAYLPVLKSHLNTIEALGKTSSQQIISEKPADPD